jgi:hypothetical protein
MQVSCPRNRFRQKSGKRYLVAFVPVRRWPTFAVGGAARPRFVLPQRGRVFLPEPQRRQAQGRSRGKTRGPIQLGKKLVASNRNGWSGSQGGTSLVAGII